MNTAHLNGTSSALGNVPEPLRWPTVPVGRGSALIATILSSARLRPCYRVLQVPESPVPGRLASRSGIGGKASCAQA